MLYGNKNISSYSKTNMTLWMLLSFQAGTLNIGGFMACNRFVSHVTGLSAYLGHEIYGSNKLHALGLLVGPIFFLFGAMLSGQMVDLRIHLDKKPKYYVTFGLMFLLICSVYLGGHFGVFGDFGEPLILIRDYTLLTLLCFTCGMQNATVTIVSKSVIRTTHLTGTVTDLGVGLIRVFNKKSLNANLISDEIKANIMRVGTIFFFFFGSVFGGYIFKFYKYDGFIIPVLTSGFLFLIMIYYQAFKRYSTTSKVKKSEETLTKP